MDGYSVRKPKCDRIIVKEFYYHKARWKRYCDKRNINKIQKVLNADKGKRNECFEKLCQTINENIYIHIYIYIYIYIYVWRSHKNDSDSYVL